ncbi:hypothetical protein [Mixta tenebrionis]|uniref:hypothetical protein n=1 Tax=Mixta tenebrionis TaxID=2562439 RepID=UPI0015E834CF|nr:hypothetical protein [Mixta tenebrionis]
MALFHQDGCRGGIRAMLPVACCLLPVACCLFLLPVAAGICCFSLALLTQSHQRVSVSLRVQQNSYLMPVSSIPQVRPPVTVKNLTNPAKMQMPVNRNGNSAYTGGRAIAG